MTIEERIIEAARRVVDACDAPSYEEAFGDLRDALGLPDAWLGSEAMS